MCIFSGRVTSVRKTSIFVGLADEGRTQVVVYGNSVGLGQAGGVRMVLPFPQGACELLPPEVLDGDALIKYLHRALYPGEKVPGQYYGSCGAGGTLDVVRVGSYRCSVAPAREDLQRVDRAVFGIDDDVYDFVSRKYPAGYGFVICALVEGETFHPFAYKHSRAPDGRMFVPTLHFHRHGDGRVDEAAADWDHVIFSLDQQLTGLIRYKKRHATSKDPGIMERVAYFGASVGLVRGTAVYGYRISNYSHNHDLFGSVAAAPG